MQILSSYLSQWILEWNSAITYNPTIKSQELLLRYSTNTNIHGLAQDFSIVTADAHEILQSCI